MMTRTVLFYGSSLLLAGVAAGLGQYPDLHVTQAATWTEASRLLAEHMPDVLIFDLCHAPETHILPLLLARPGMLMVGLDAESNRAMLVSEKKARLLTLNQIREMIGEPP